MILSGLRERQRERKREREREREKERETAGVRGEGWRKQLGWGAQS